MRNLKIMTSTAATIAAITALLLSSCVRDEHGDTSKGGRISVRPSITISDVASYGAEGTRAVEDDETTSGIGSLWVLQFEGTGDDAPLVVANNISDWDAFDTADGVVEVLPCGESTFWYLANVYDSGITSQFHEGLTLETLKAMSFDLTDKASAFGKASALGGSDFPDDAEYRIRMSGTYTATVTAATDALPSCTLHRNVARIRFGLTNGTASGTNPLTPLSIQVCNVPSKYPLCHDVDPLDINGCTLTDMYRERWDGGEEYVAYVPKNCRGTVTNSDDSQKTGLAPDSATFVRMTGTYPEDGKTALAAYTIYPGKNNTSDFNVETDASYDVDLVLGFLGNPLSDTRVNLSAAETEANCYICSPRNAYALTVGRGDTFWGGNGYEYTPSCVIGANGHWTSEIMWSDIPCDRITLEKDEGYGSDDIMIVSFETHGEEGNAVLAVKLNGTVVWTYHLWITDYDPDALAANWMSGAKTMMTRDLGATSDGYAGTEGLYYQFGRPTGIPGSQRIYTPGNTSGFVWSKSTYSISSSDTGSEVSGANVPYAIQHPMMFIKSGDAWTLGDKYNPSSYDSAIIWQDPDASTRSDGKSLFDPCPAGWRLPVNGEYNAMTTSVWGDYGRTSNNLFFPASGYQYCSSADFGVVGTNGYRWTSSPSSPSNGSHLYFLNNLVSPSNNSARAFGFPVRCIKN